MLFVEGAVEVRHFDPYSQALSKIERGLTHDLDEVRQMLDRGLVDPTRLHQLYDDIEADLYRYPALDPTAFRRKLQAALPPPF